MRSLYQKNMQKAKPIIAAKTTAPAIPSHVFPGLIVGENLCFPNMLPSGVSPYIRDFTTKTNIRSAHTPKSTRIPSTNAPKRPKIRNGKKICPAIAKHIGGSKTIALIKKYSRYGKCDYKKQVHAICRKQIIAANTSTSPKALRPEL